MQEFIEEIFDSIHEDWRNIIIPEEVHPAINEIFHPDIAGIIMRFHGYDKMKQDLIDILKKLYDKRHDLCPHYTDIFSFTQYTPLNKLCCVILGQDPYPNKMHAHGLAFSSKTGIPASLKNIYKCLEHNKLIKKIPDTGNLIQWSARGVLLLNTSLTTLHRCTGAHMKLWNDFVKNIILRLPRGLTFFLWGNYAQGYEDILSNHKVLKYAHPSPLQRAIDFKLCDHFSQVDIDWNIRTTQYIFTDGSSYPNKKGAVNARGGYSCLFIKGGIPDVSIYGALPLNPTPTNIRVEGYALIRSLEYLALPRNYDLWDKACIYTDCKFWIDVIYEYFPKWGARGVSLDEKQNPDLLKRLKRAYEKAVEGKTVEIKHLYSHNKSGWKTEKGYKKWCYCNNEYVDAMCNYARVNLTPGTEITESR